MPFYLMPDCAPPVIDMALAERGAEIARGMAHTLMANMPSPGGSQGNDDGAGIVASSIVIAQTSAEAGAREAARIVRSQRLRDMLAAVAEFWRASGADRAYWRGQAAWLIREWRRVYELPERAAFRAAVARSRRAAA
jgi:hypothetical protein